MSNKSEAQKTGGDRSSRQNIIMQEFREALGEEWVSDSPSVLSNYCAAYDGGPAGNKPEIVVFPSSGDEVRQVVSIVKKYEVPLLSMSAFFDHTGDSVSGHGGVLMDLRRMDIVGG